MDSIGWRALDSKLSELESEFRSALGDEWIKKAHQEFRSEVEKMKDGEYGNARIVARNSDASLIFPA